MTNQTTVFVAGATGMLGARIVESLLRRGARVRALVRAGTAADKRAVLDASASANENLQIVQGDILDPVDQLARIVDGAEVVISAVQGGPDVIINGQVNLLRAAERAGVLRMMPSDFGVDLQRLDYGDNDFYDLRKKADEAFATSRVRPVYLFNGAFPEFVIQPISGLVDFEKNTFSYWGDGDQPIDFTTIRDTAEYTAAAVLDPTVAGRKVCVAGQVLTMKQFHEAVEQGSGQSLEIRHLGTTVELRAEIERRKATAQSLFEYIALQFQWVFATGKGKMLSLDNDLYPDIRPTSVVDSVRQARSQVGRTGEQANP